MKGASQEVAIGGRLRKMFAASKLLHFVKEPRYCFTIVESVMTGKREKLGSSIVDDSPGYRQLVRADGRRKALDMSIDARAQ